MSDGFAHGDNLCWTPRIFESAMLRCAFLETLDEAPRPPRFARQRQRTVSPSGEVPRCKEKVARPDATGTVRAGAAGQLRSWPSGRASLRETARGISLHELVGPSNPWRGGAGAAAVSCGGACLPDGGRCGPRSTGTLPRIASAGGLEAQRTPAPRSRQIPRKKRARSRCAATCRDSVGTGASLAFAANEKGRPGNCMKDLHGMRFAGRVASWLAGCRKVLAVVALPWDPARASELAPGTAAPRALSPCPIARVLA